MKRRTVVAGATVSVILHSIVATAADESHSVRHTADRPGPIVFDSDRDGDPEIYLMESGVALSQPITKSGPGIFSRLPDWSPDCTEVVFQSNRLDAENHDLYVMRSDGSGARRITRHPRSDTSPDWSPDGLMIAFASDRGRKEAVWVIGSDGSGLRRITPGPNPAFQPSWSPDGTQIVFLSTRDFGSDGDTQKWHEVDIYEMQSDGSDTRRLTNNQHFDAHPDWCSSRSSAGTIDTTSTQKSNADWPL